MRQASMQSVLFIAAITHLPHLLSQNGDVNVAFYNILEVMRIGSNRVEKPTCVDGKNVPELASDIKIDNARK